MHKISTNRKKNRIKEIFILVSWLLAFVSCDSKRVFEDYMFTGNNGWHKDSAIIFRVPVKDITSSYNIYLNIRNRGNYPNSNIWLFIDIQFPDGRLKKDSIELVLAWPDGKWKGDGIGDLFEEQFVYEQNIHFPVEGDYLFFIRHGMRTLVLKGIRDVGMRMETMGN